MSVSFSKGLLNRRQRFARCMVAGLFLAVVDPWQ